MRVMTGLFFAVLLMQGLAFGESGYKATLTTTDKMTDEKLKYIKENYPADDLDSHPQQSVFVQEIYWSDTCLREDYISGDGIESTSIYDFSNDMFYSFNSVDPVAEAIPLWHMTWGDPREMFLSYVSAIQHMQDDPHTIVTKLPSKTISELRCQGISFNVDLEAIRAGFEGSQDEWELGTIIGLRSGTGGLGGEVWVCEELKYPVLVDYWANGNVLKFEMSNIEHWTVDESMFVVPDGYEIEEYEMPDFGDREVPETHAY